MGFETVLGSGSTVTRQADMLSGGLEGWQGTESSWFSNLAKNLLCGFAVTLPLSVLQFPKKRLEHSGFHPLAVLPLTPTPVIVHTEVQPERYPALDRQIETGMVQPVSLPPAARHKEHFRL